MHDRAAWPTGAIKSAAAITVEIMILLNIDLRIAQVRPRVEKRVQHLLLLLVFLLLPGLWDHNYEYEDKMLAPPFATALWSPAKAFEVATDMLVVIIESSEN
jgi:hypothetical protein